MIIKSMTAEELETRKAELLANVEQDGADLDAIQAEAESIKAELESRKAAAAAEAETRAAVANGSGKITETRKQEEKKTMNAQEFRNSKAYVNAFASYIKSGKEDEIRRMMADLDEETRTALISENVSGGTVPVPELVSDTVKHAWEEDGIMSLVKKSFAKGNLKVGFEISGGDAVAHTEGGDAVAEQTLVTGIVSLVPASIMAWKSISEEVLDMDGETFLQYIYDEIAHRIAQKASDTLLDAIIACGTASTTTCVGVPVITSTTVTVGLVAEATGNLSGEARNPVVILNPKTWAAFKKAQYDNKFSVDPFEGYKVIKNSHITAFSAATTGTTWCIVGDLGYGAMANFPNGEEIKFKLDDTTSMKSGLVNILGREYVGIAPVAPNAFVKIVK